MKVVLPFTVSRYNLASYNRICGYVRGLREQGVEIEFLLFVGEDLKALIEGAPDARVYFNKKNYIGVFRFVQYLKNSFQKLNITKRVLATGDVLFLYGLNYEFHPAFFRIKDVKMVIEQTEYPELTTRNKRKAILRKFSKAIWKRADLICVISEKLREYFIGIGIPEERIERINMFVDVSRFDNVSKDDNAGKYIAYCGSVSMYKDGVDCLIRAFSIFSKYHPEFNLKIIGKLLGEEVGVEINRLLDELGVVEKVEMTGLVSPSEMPSLLCNASILALARPNNIQAQYGFPTKLGEYLSTGVPVVVTNVGELGMFLRDYDNCRISEPDSPDEFADKLSWVADNLAAASEMAKDAKILAHTEFSYKTQSNKLLKKLAVL